MLQQRIAESLEDELTIHDRICKLQDAARVIDPIVVASAVEIIQAAGFECLQAASEADFLLVTLSEVGRCDYIATDDADILVMGAQRTIRGLSALLINDISARVFTRDDILKSIDLKSEQLLELACLLGCDYQNSIPRIGPVTALKIIQVHGTIKVFLGANGDKYALSMTVEEYLRQCARTVEIFKSRPDVQYDIR